MAKNAPILVSSLVPHETIVRKIYLIRGKRVMLDRDLAALYEVSTSYLNRQVKRHRERFPVDFMFQLSNKEFKNLICQFGTSSWGGSRKRPLVFTEHGILMLSSVLNAKRAIRVNIQIMRTFTKIREFILNHKDLQRKIEELEKKYDAQFRVVFETIRELEEPLRRKRIRQIGFHAT